MKKEELILLIDRQRNGTLTDAEQEILRAFFDLEENKELVTEAFSELLYRETSTGSYDAQRFEKMLSAAVEVDKISQPAHLTPVLPAIKQRVHFLSSIWFRSAAAIFILLAGITTYNWYLHQPEKNVVVAVNRPDSSALKIIPGGNKATLTLADGSVIVLDSASNGRIAVQGNSQVLKLANGQIAYNSDGAKSEVVLYNNMVTPRGGQYELTLPDGTKAWLNAASSIRYPTAFTGKNREVSITGEVYFSVSKDKTKPFIVTVNNINVTVLGTAFNINSYDNEPSIKTTLVEGSVKISVGNAFELLKPGQQADVSQNTITLINNINTEQVMAWKSGLFNFKNADLKTVMRQLERWYDINVIYEGNPAPLKFGGELDRGVNLSDVIEILSRMNIKCQMEGRTLTIMK